MYGDLNVINFYIRSKGQNRHLSWPFDEADQITTIRSASVPRVNEYVNIENETKDEETITYNLYRVAFVGYRITKGNIYEACVLLE